jgi:hypothetical protein
VAAAGESMSRQAPGTQRAPGGHAAPRLVPQLGRQAANSGLDPTLPLPGSPTVAALVMARVRGGAVPWALWQLVQRGASLRGVPGLRFGRVMGSGAGGGFGLKPGLDCQGVFAMFDTLASAERFVAESPVVRAYRERSAEHSFFTATLRVTSSRGSWGGVGMAPGAVAEPGQPVVALTRAAIRTSRAVPFWRHSPAAEAEIAQAPGCRLAVGLGEAPLLRQATVSLWDSAQAMDAYARHGSHQRAIAAAWQQRFFSEWMFVRFLPVTLQGAWQGRALAVGAGGG